MDRSLLFASSSLTSAVAVIVAVGVGCLWLAPRLKIPSILLLLPAGIVAGPVLGILDPDKQFGDVLFPAVSLGVGILLFEGGLGLRFDKVGGVQGVVGRLVSVGALITWVIAGLTVWQLFDLRRATAALIGALLIVSGPTVVQPLLRLAKPRPSVAEVLRWEGIVIDPIGATLGVVVLDALLKGASPSRAAISIALTLGTGAVVGGGLGIALAWALGNHWVPDHLQNPVALATAIASFALADIVAPEAGLMATTALGLVLANQRRAPSRHIREFEEELSLVVLGGLFMILGARVDLDELAEVLPKAVILTLVLILVARPLAVAASTVGSALTVRERAMLAFVAPRGIVAAAVSAVFALEIEHQGQEPGPIVAITFSVIVLTVIFYGFSAVPAAKFLKVARPPQRAVAIVGAEPWHLQLAEALQDNGVPIMLFTDQIGEREEAQDRALLVFWGELQNEDVEEAAEALGIQTVLVLSDRTELATAVVSSLGPLVGRPNVYSLAVGRGLDGAGVGSAMAVRSVFRTSDEDLAARTALSNGATFVRVDPEQRREGDVVIGSFNGSVAPTLSFDRTNGDQLLILRLPQG